MGRSIMSALLPAAILAPTILVPTLVFTAQSDAGERPTIVATAPQAQQPPSAEKKDEELPPEEKMRRRFPQPVRVGDLIGLPVLDWRDSTIGYIREVVRTPAGKIQLVVPYSAWFGWARTICVLHWCRRPVAVPLETVAILARQVDVLEFSREQFDAAPTFEPSQATPVGPEETIRIAITRR